MQRLTQDIIVEVVESCRIEVEACRIIEALFKKLLKSTQLRKDKAGR